jgi:hypothetical protein
VTHRFEPHGARRTFQVAGLVLAAAAGVACKSPSKAKDAAPVPARSVAKPVDRLLPGELPAGEGQVFGLAVPRGMTVKASVADSALLEGNVPPESLANYVRDRVDVAHVEIGVARTLFPSARIRDGAADRSYEIEVVAGNGTPTRLIVRDVTPHGRNGPPDMTEEERWRQAGLTPDGKPLDLAEFK